MLKAKNAANDRQATGGRQKPCLAQLFGRYLTLKVIQRVEYVLF